MRALVTTPNGSDGGDDQGRRVQLSLDGSAIQTLRTAACGQQTLASFNVNLEHLTAGSHSLSVSASKGDSEGEDGNSGSASITFVLDPSLPNRKMNVAEQAATPEPFTCLSTSRNGEQHDEDNQNAPTIAGSFSLSAQSDGIDLARDRVVLAFDDKIAVLEPGSFQCKEHDHCQFLDVSRPLVQAMTLVREDGKWTFTVTGKTLPATPKLFALRIGNDWGGRNLTTGEFVFDVTPSLDTAHQARAVIGSAGGTLQTTDGSGAIIRLDVPAGALTADTAIQLTPRLSSALTNASGTIHPGVELAPGGLQFAIPATLTFNFIHTTRSVSSFDTIYLITSPLTALPLFRKVDPTHNTIAAHIYHFSDYDPGAAASAFEDLKAWADPILNAAGVMDFQTLEALAAFDQQQMAAGCTQNCVDLAHLTAAVENSVRTVVNQSCPSAVANPTDDLLNHFLELEALVQSVGGNVPEVNVCVKQILSAQIDQASSVAASPDASDPTLSRLAALASRAQQLGFSDLETKALQKMDQALLDLANRIVTQARSADGTPNATQAHQDGIDQLTKEQVWLTTPDLTGIDPNLATVIQNDLDSLKQTSKFRVSLIGAGTCNANVGGVWLNYAPPLSLPVRAHGSGCGGDITMSAAQIGDNTVVFNASGFQGTSFGSGPNLEGLSTFVGQITVVVHLSSPATVQLDVNTNWATNAPPQIVDGSTYTLDGGIYTPGGVLVYDFSRKRFYDGATTRSINLPAGTHNITVSLNARSIVANAGSGWFATITVQ
jgi:hypothetical protein